MHFKLLKNPFQTTTSALLFFCFLAHISFLFFFRLYNFNLLFWGSVISASLYAILYIFYNYIPQLVIFTCEYILIHLYCILFSVITKQAAGTQLFILGMTAAEFLFLQEIKHPKWYYVALVIPSVIIAIVLTVFFTWKDIVYLPAPKGFYHIHEIFCTTLTLIMFVYLCLTVENLFLKHEERLTYSANHDPLTGLLNRRKLWTDFEHFQQIKEKHNVDYALGIFDIDDFKRVNDTYGHDCGDYILKQVTSLVQQMLPDSYILGRWGGEEFVILYPSTTNVIELTENIRSEISKHSFCYKNNSIKLTITITFGIGYSFDCNSVEDTIIEADKYLLLGKKKGKNCTYSKRFPQA